MAMHTSFLTHAKGRYLWIAVLVAILSSLAFIFDEPTEPPNGGTPLGYTLGTIGAIMILWLAYLGRRKRNFVKGWGTTVGWVSAHVYLGCALLVIVTLHTGFQFGWNIHTLAYVLMVCVILSGIFGVVAYRTYPGARNELKKTKSLDDIFLQVEEVDAQLLRMASDAPEDIRNILNSAIERTVVGGGFLDQVRARDNSVVELNGRVESNKQQQRALDYLLGRARELQGDQLKLLHDIIRIFNTRKRLLSIIRDDIRMHAVTSVWLLFHIPITFALIASLIAHVFAVFVYW
ncbi:MAG: hypothetical protein JJ957_01510 [Pseudomonadales bacterium]|nr:hypothetical protein [Pseudomonadales bacterium]MBO6594487.1 hypothetical protein [Pseudomonadales bacterium]MBO6821952.1 hypothetical protein [Pseudomonadales bacterium]